MSTELENKKEDRSEYVSIYVTPTLKKEFELAKDNQSLKESIIKNYLSSERNWLEDELKQVDESTIKYSAKLIGIKEKFQLAQNAYVEEIESIYKTANNTFKKLDTISSDLEKKLANAYSDTNQLISKINSMDFSKIERLLDLTNRVSNMSTSEKELLKKLLNY